MTLGETREVDFDRRFMKISRSAKLSPVSAPEHTPSRVDVHHRPHTSPFDAQSGSFERGRRPRRPGSKKIKKMRMPRFELGIFCSGGRRGIHFATSPVLSREKRTGFLAGGSVRANMISFFLCTTVDDESSRPRHLRSVVVVSHFRSRPASAHSLTPGERARAREQGIHRRQGPPHEPWMSRCARSRRRLDARRSVDLSPSVLPSRRRTR
jgi:hypothetical protein